MALGRSLCPFRPPSSLRIAQTMLAAVLRARGRSPTHSDSPARAGPASQGSERTYCDCRETSLMAHGKRALTYRRFCARVLEMQDWYFSQTPEMLSPAKRASAGGRGFGAVPERDQTGAAAQKVREVLSLLASATRGAHGSAETRSDHGESAHRARLRPERGGGRLCSAASSPLVPPGKGPFDNLCAQTSEGPGSVSAPRGANRSSRHR